MTKAQEFLTNEQIVRLESLVQAIACSDKTTAASAIIAKANEFANFIRGHRIPEEQGNK